ncbi:MAG: winged helix-turn-helix transcriptional regulator [Bacteroidia bacterium]|nr:winged helix-turn-helix transcriptional regulator [Bacteroidia bacterium]
MAASKKEQFDKEDIELAEFAKALSHPARVAIIKTLAKKNECVCGEIVEVLPLAQATVSQHLSELKKAGLIQGRVEGQNSCYCLDQKTFDKFIKAFSKFSEKIKSCDCR